MLLTSKSSSERLALTDQSSNDDCTSLQLHILGRRSRRGKTDVAPFVGCRVGFVLNDAFVRLGVGLGDDIAEESNHADPERLNDKDIQQNTKEETSVEDLDVRVAPSFTLAVGESSEEGEQDDAQREGEDVSAEVLDTDGSDGRGAGAHDRGARGAEPPSGETTEVSPSSRNNHGEALEAAERRTCRFRSVATSLQKHYQNLLHRVYLAQWVAALVLWFVDTRASSQRKVVIAVWLFLCETIGSQNYRFVSKPTLLVRRLVRVVEIQWGSVSMPSCQCLLICLI